MARLRSPGRRRKGYRKRRPWPAPCLRDGCPRVARPDRRWKRVEDRRPWATAFCSDRCKEAERRHRHVQGTQTDLANEIRRLLGLEGGRGPAFTYPELQRIRAAVTRLVDYRARHDG